ncbi:MAG: hypothetical protein H6P98_716 [Candidatus Aminicenantes bacterium]|nr:hypothetical protein [Candidatus Aminicenantes bacterium]
MKTRRAAALIISVFILASTAFSVKPYGVGQVRSIWRQFVAALRKGEMTAERLRPYYEELRSPLLGYLKEIRQRVAWAEMAVDPEVHRVGAQVHYLVPLTFEGPRVTYVFSFLTENDSWYFQHLEAITIRMDNVGALPASTFPDVPEETKAHIREEVHWSREVQVFNVLAKDKGKEFAFDFFRDGNGYFLAARAWVPYVEPSRAFILYLCWEQANLIGNDVILEKVEDREAIVRLRTGFFRLYKVSAHLGRQISFEDYRKIFETIWQDRARAAGWELRIEYFDKDYPGAECVFRFTRK